MVLRVVTVECLLVDVRVVVGTVVVGVVVVNKLQVKVWAICNIDVFKFATALYKNLSLIHI